MSSAEDIRARLRASDTWLDRKGPEDHVVVSSRARYARNFTGIPFPLRARTAELRTVVEKIAAAVERTPQFAGCLHFDLTAIRPVERNYLKENHLISKELEKGGEGRCLYVSRDIRHAVMVNEEDHIRMYVLAAGFQTAEVLNEVIALEDELARELAFAFSPRFGYLTACPTNTGTGLRASVMVHLPALTMMRQAADVFKPLPQHGVTVRGFYGESSEHMGDFFQISNEVTLGKTEVEIVTLLTSIVEDVIEKEEQARRVLFDQNRRRVDDEVWRAYGVLTNARIIASQEAVSLLSKLRFGIDRGYFPELTHTALNKLVIAVQPGHLLFEDAAPRSTEERDIARADLLRHILTRRAANN